MKIALLGLAQAGKKTFFSLLTGRKSATLALPEGESLEGLAPIYDPRVVALAELFKPERVKFAENCIVLCPDVVEGGGAPAAAASAKTGKRPWLEAARRCDLLCLLVRAFSSAAVYHPKGGVDAERDRAFLESECLLADLELIENRLAQMAKEKRAGQTPQQVQEEQTLQKIQAILEREMRWTAFNLAPHELDAIRSLNLLTLKPLLWAYNVDENALAGDSAGPKGGFKISCRIEQEIMALDSPEERQAYLKELGVNQSGLDRLNQAAYDRLGLMSFYTVGKDEVRAWTIRKGTLAPAAAGKVHSDIERGFIRVEVTKFDDLMAAGGEAAAKAQGKVQVKGRDYIIENGDVCHFRFNV
jgi:GTP-binding protein YchF